MSHRPQFTTSDRPYEEWRALNAGTLAACYSSIETAKRCWDLVDRAYPDPDARREAYAAINARLDQFPRGDLAARDNYLRAQIAALEKRLGIAPAPAQAEAPAPPPTVEEPPVWYLAKVINARLVGSDRFTRYHVYPCRRENGALLLVNPGVGLGVVLTQENARRALELVRDRYDAPIKADRGLAADAEGLAADLLLV